MTYQVLLVDDEPIILSGIKFLIDWEKNNCVIAGTARNGQQALKAMEELQPHIVICDINMPMISGIDLLKTVSEKSSLPVFIMLTNYGEFDLAREALRHQAVDYLLKSQLEPETLEKSLILAKQEYKKRGGLMKVTIADHYIRLNQSQIVAQNLKQLLDAKKYLPEENLRNLENEAVLKDYAFVRLFLDFSVLPQASGLSEDEITRLFAWEQEVTEKLAGNLFSNYTVFDQDGHRHALLLFCWNLPPHAAALMKQFYTKLCTASGNITQIGLSMSATRIYFDSAEMKQALSEMQRLDEHYYNGAGGCLFLESLNEEVFETISFADISNRLVSAIRTKNILQCAQLLTQATEIISCSIHCKKNAIKECASLYSTVSSVIAPLLPKHQGNEFFTDDTVMLDRIPSLSTKKEVISWLNTLSLQIVRQLEQLNSSKSDLAQKARNYVIENIDKRILLQDAADFVSLSPNYLSALFKKEYNQNFVDFINETKTERAQSLIEEGRYRMYEISYMLGFDNAYYFTKVFKKHTGLTPTEYQRKIHPTS